MKSSSVSSNLIAEKLKTTKNAKGDPFNTFTILASSNINVWQGLIKSLEDVKLQYLGSSLSPEIGDVVFIPEKPIVTAVEINNAIYKQLLSNQSPIAVVYFKDLFTFSITMDTTVGIQIKEITNWIGTLTLVSFSLLPKVSTFTRLQTQAKQWKIDGQPTTSPQFFMDNAKLRERFQLMISARISDEIAKDVANDLAKEISLVTTEHKEISDFLLSLRRDIIPTDLNTLLGEINNRHILSDRLKTADIKILTMKTRVEKPSLEFINDFKTNLPPGLVFDNRVNYYEVRKEDCVPIKSSTLKAQVPLEKLTWRHKIDGIPIVVPAEIEAFIKNDDLIGMEFSNVANVHDHVVYSRMYLDQTSAWSNKIGYAPEAPQDDLSEDIIGVFANCYIDEDTFELRLTRDVKAGEFLTTDYGEAFFSDNSYVPVIDFRMAKKVKSLTERNLMRPYIADHVFQVSQIVQKKLRSIIIDEISNQILNGTLNDISDLAFFSCAKKNETTQFAVKSLISQIVKAIGDKEREQENLVYLQDVEDARKKKIRSTPQDAHSNSLSALEKLNVDDKKLLWSLASDHWIEIDKKLRETFYLDPIMYDAIGSVIKEVDTRDIRIMHPAKTIALRDRKPVLGSEYLLPYTADTIYSLALRKRSAIIDKRMLDLSRAGIKFDFEERKKTAVAETVAKTLGNRLSLITETRKRENMARLIVEWSVIPFAIPIVGVSKDIVYGSSQQIMQHDIYKMDFITLLTVDELAKINKVNLEDVSTEYKILEEEHETEKTRRKEKLKALKKSVIEIGQPRRAIKQEEKKRQEASDERLTELDGARRLFDWTATLILRYFSANVKLEQDFDSTDVKKYESFLGWLEKKVSIWPADVSLWDEFKGYMASVMQTQVDGKIDIHSKEYRDLSEKGILVLTRIVEKIENSKDPFFGIMKTTMQEIKI